MNAYHAKTRPWRIGLIVPSSNTTLETEIPALLQRQSVVDGSRFSFHSMRLRLRHNTPEGLQAMNLAAGDAIDALCDAQVDSIVYGCLIAAMSGGKASTVETGQRLAASRQLHAGGAGIGRQQRRCARRRARFARRHAASP